MSAPTVTRYALTHVNRDGMRTLTLPNQGRHMFDDERTAQAYLVAFEGNNDTKRLVEVFGKQAIGTFAVRPVACYTNGDATRIYFDR